MIQLSKTSAVVVMSSSNCMGTHLSLLFFGTPVRILVLYCSFIKVPPFPHMQSAYRRVAHDIPIRFTKLAHQAGVPHYSVLTASVSNPNSWSLYIRSKGQLEATGQELFPHTSAFRAGPLNRGEDSRFIEKIGCELSSCLRLCP